MSSCIASCGPHLRTAAARRLLSTRNLRHAAAHFTIETRPRDVSAVVSRWRGENISRIPKIDGLVGTRNYWVVLRWLFSKTATSLFDEASFEEELVSPLHKSIAAKSPKWCACIERARATSCARFRSPKIKRQCLLREFSAMSTA